MDLNALWDIISPYITDASVVTAVTTVIVVMTKIYSAVKTAMAAQKATAEANKDQSQVVANAITKALPNTVNLKIDKIVEPYLKSLTASVVNKVSELEDKSDTNEQKLDTVLQMLRCLKSVPDNLKDEATALLKEKPVEEVLTVDLKSAVVEAASPVKVDAASKYEPLE